MKKIYFMRHGLTVMNQQGLRAGSTETPLTDEGRAVAKAAGAAAKDYGINLIVSSSMGRAVETAEIVAAEIGYPVTDIVITDLLVERHFGVLEGQPYVADQDVDLIEGIEHEQILFERVQKALDWIETLPGDTVLIVAHGATGRAIRHVLHSDTPFFGAGHFPNAEIFELERK